MKLQGILNSEISSVLSFMGHYDSIAIGDCGLPIPQDVKRIDLALAFQKPTMLEVLEELLKDFIYEYVILAEEIHQQPQLLKRIEELVGASAIRFISHEDFKKETHNSRAVIRSGDTTPYANIILVSAVVF